MILLGGGTKQCQQDDIRTDRGLIDGLHEKEKVTMALTRDFRETILARVRRDPAFRKELLREGVESFVAGDVETGKSVLRDYINATIGFAKLGEATNHSAKSLMRMLGPSGNPQARNLFEIVDYLQRREKVRSKVAAAAR